jgi:hypothetical protein
MLVLGKFAISLLEGRAAPHANRRRHPQGCCSILESCNPRELNNRWSASMPVLFSITLCNPPGFMLSNQVTKAIVVAHSEGAS